jgi:hypothetical protein
MFSKVLVIIATLLGVTSAFLNAGARSSTRSMVKMISEDRSVALPFDKRPAALDGSLAGDAGFDPAGFTNNPRPIKGIPALKWYREAEVAHGRVAMLATVGFFFPAIAHFPGGALGVSEDAYANLNPYGALTSVPEGALWQIAVAIFGVELVRIKRTIKGDKGAGDLGLGQTGFNPFNFNYTPEEYFEKQVQEIKHGRLAMFGILGMILQLNIVGKPFFQQIGDAFTYPEARALTGGLPTIGVLNDYFPQGL